MTKIGLLSMMMLVCITACKKEQAKISDNLAREAVVSPLLVDTIRGSDWSGSVHIIVVSQQISGEHNEVDISIPDDYVLVGGGGAVTPQATTPGALLTASYPGSNFSTWHAVSKDHLTPFSHTLTGYAIGLKLEGFTKKDLLTLISIDSLTSGDSAHPTAHVSVPKGYTLLGGGARVDYGNGLGNILVNSFPSGDTWYTGSKDQDWTSPATITAYAIGINQAVLLKGNWEVTQAVDSIYSQSGFRYFSLNFDQSWVVTSPGAATTYAGDGRVLNTIFSDIRKVFVGTQDFQIPDGGITYAYGVAIRRKF
jgi:hypothetical protein